MFTGIVEEIGTIKAIRKGKRSSQITIAARKVIEDMKAGDSINTAGVCLTVTAFAPGEFTVDVMPETMNRTKLLALKTGDQVNLERALRLSDRLGGHLVSGHIDGTGLIRKVWTEDNSVWITIATDPGILKYIAEKGSIAIDGISLTVVKIDRQSFDVSLIPHTLANTAIGKKEGDIVNIECDMIAKYLERLKQAGTNETKINLGFLAEHGYL